MGRKKGKEIRSRVVSLRMEPELEKATTLVGQVHNRSLSNMIFHIVDTYIRENYPEAFDPDATVAIVRGK